MNPEPMVSWLIQEGVRWVKWQRETNRPHGRALNDQEVEAMRPFFSAGTLNDASVRIVPLIPNPSFYPMIQNSGLRLIDFSQMVGITFIDTILIASERVEPDPLPLRLVFHELVHVVQYQLVGVEEFINRYVRGWIANGQDYLAIPIESQAREYDERFVANPHTGFSVEAYVKRAGVPI